MKIKTNLRAGSGSTSTDSTSTTDTSLVSGSNSKKTLGGGAVSGGGRCAGY